MPAKDISRIVFPVALIVLLTSGCQSMGLDRYSAYMLGNTQGRYAGLKNPVTASGETAILAKKLYQDNCTACHGMTGKGDGELSAEYRPRPAKLIFTRNLPIATDAFFFWTISEGGEAFGTATPSFADSLSEEEIGQIISFITDDL